MKRDDNKPWFAAKRYGYGAGLPIAWQGWALLLGYFVIAGLTAPVAFLIVRDENIAAPLFVAALLVETAALCVICARKTKGGWHWRWGGRD